MPHLSSRPRAVNNLCCFPRTHGAQDQAAVVTPALLLAFRLRLRDAGVTLDVFDPAVMRDELESLLPKSPTPTPEWGADPRDGLARSIDLQCVLSGWERRFATDVSRKYLAADQPASSRLEDHRQGKASTWPASSRTGKSTDE